MQHGSKTSRAEIIIRAWRESDTAESEDFRGSVSTLNGKHSAQFVGLPQLFNRVAKILQQALNQEPTP